MKPIRISIALLVVAAVLAAPAGAQAPFDPRGVDPASPNPLVGLPLFVDHDSPGWEAWRKYERRGQRGKAALAWRIAREPRSLWFGKFTRPNFHFKVRRRIDAAKAVGEVPVFTLLRAEASGLGSPSALGTSARGSSSDSGSRPCSPLRRRSS